jgi:hypothetical protein
MVKFLLAVLALSLAGCSTAAVQTRPAIRIVQSKPNATGSITVADVLGQWDVVNFEGHEPARMQGTIRAAIADFAEQRVRLRIECNSSTVGGVVRDGRFVPQPALRMQTEMGCGKERELRDERYFSFFERSAKIERVGNGRLRFVAGDSVLILERPEQRRLAFVPGPLVIEGVWRMEELTQYERNGGYSGIGLSDVPGRIVIEGGRLSYDRCPQYGLAFRYSSDGRLMKTAGPPVPEKPDCPALNYPEYEAPALPSAMKVLTLLHSSPWVEDVGNGRLLIGNEHFGLLVSRAEKP